MEPALTGTGTLATKRPRLHSDRLAPEASLAYGASSLITRRMPLHRRRQHPVDHVDDAVAGRQIGSVAELPSEELERLVREDEASRPPVPITPQRPDRSEEVGAAVSLIRAMDGPGLDALLRRRLAALGVAAFLDELIAPLLRRVGDEWHVGRMTIAQEHLSSSVVRQVLMSIVATPMHVGPADTRVLIATTSGDQHELALFWPPRAPRRRGGR